MDFANSTRAAENRTRGKGIVVKSSLVAHDYGIDYTKSLGH